MGWQARSASLLFTLPTSLASLLLPPVLECRGQGAGSEMGGEVGGKARECGVEEDTPEKKGFDLLLRVNGHRIWLF